MINGVHALLYANDADKTRAFLRDLLGLRCVDAGEGWLIFALPPAELGVHPQEGEVHHQLYFMCDDVAATVAELSAKGVKCSEVRDQGWGLVTSLEVPGAGSIGIYQPRHPTAITLVVSDKNKKIARKKRLPKSRPSSKTSASRKKTASRRAGRSRKAR
jgi:catechol 2,3-dioxygenase-like lactoylglutathione lyase family enzyme